MNWRPAQPGCISELQKPFFDFQNQRGKTGVSYLSNPEIIKFHWHRLCKQIQERAGQKPLTLFQDHDGIQAIAGVEHSAWHSQHLGLPYYKIQPFYCFTTHSPTIQKLTRQFCETLDQPNRVYTGRVEASQTALSYAFGVSGFTHVGTSIRMIYTPSSQFMIDSPTQDHYDRLTIRDYRESDLPVLQSIIERSHTHSHFFSEMRFSPQRVRDLFSQWIRTCAMGLAKKIWVAELEGVVCGFCSLLLNESIQSFIGQPIGVIDFIVVDHHVQGKGVGRKLVIQAKDWLEQYTNSIELRTMVDNLHAIRFYEKNGFRMLSADHHFHLWT